MTYHRWYKVVSVRATVPDSQAERYVLVQCGAPTPRLEGDLMGAQIARVPISSLYSVSTTHLPLLVDLQRLDVLTGVSQMKHLTGDEILKRAASGQVREFAPISTIDAELVVSQRPGVLMTAGAASAPLAVIRSAGIPVVANHEWLEPTALARAEWLRYMALFLNEERAAQHAVRRDEGALQGPQRPGDGRSRGSTAHGHDRPRHARGLRDCRRPIVRGRLDQGCRRPLRLGGRHG